MSKLDEAVALVESESVAHVILAVRKDGTTFSHGNECAMLIPMLSNASRAALSPQDILTGGKVLQALTAEKSSTRGRKPGSEVRGRKPAAKEQPSKPTDPTTTT